MTKTHSEIFKFLKSKKVMKFLTILSLKFLLLSNFLMAETIPTKSKILKQSSDCLKILKSNYVKN